MVQSKRNQEKVIVTKIYLYGSATTEWKIKVFVMENKGSLAKMIEMKIAEGINILLEHKSIDCWDHLKSYMWMKMYMCTCVCMFTYTGGSHLSQIFWEHENLYILSVIQIIYIKLNKKRGKKLEKNLG